MSKYLYILNWVMAAAVILTWFYLKPIFGLAVFIGTVVGCMFSAGFVSWQYHRDPNPDKSRHWRANYFRKDYGVEILAQVGIIMAFLGLALCLWRAPFAFLGGMALMMCLNILVESAWYLFVERKHRK